MTLTDARKTVLDKLKLIALFCMPGAIPNHNYLTDKDEPDVPTREDLEEEIRILRQELWELRYKE